MRLSALLQSMCFFLSFHWQNWPYVFIYFAFEMSEKKVLMWTVA